MVQDGVASAADVDTAVSQGLGLRWSFMGPFETIDLNAPGGVSDYFERYGDAITTTCHDMKDPRTMRGSDTASRIDEAMRSAVSLEDLSVS